MTSLAIIIGETTQATSAVVEKSPAQSTTGLVFEQTCERSGRANARIEGLSTDQRFQTEVGEDSRFRMEPRHRAHKTFVTFPRHFLYLLKVIARATRPNIMD